MGNNNTDIFAELVQSTLTVTLPTLKRDIQVRRLPFATVMRTVTEVAQIIEGEFTKYGDIILANMAVLQDESIPASERGLRFAAQMFPVIRNVVASTPYLVKEILHDVLPGIPDDALDALPAEDAVSILSAVFEAMDKAVIVSQVSAIFFDLAGVIKSVIPKKKTEQIPPLQAKPGKRLEEE